MGGETIVMTDWTVMTQGEKWMLERLEKDAAEMLKTPVWTNFYIRPANVLVAEFRMNNDGLVLRDCEKPEGNSHPFMRLELSRRDSNCSVRVCLAVVSGADLSASHCQDAAGKGEDKMQEWRSLIGGALCSVRQLEIEFGDVKRVNFGAEIRTCCAARR